MIHHQEMEQIIKTDLHLYYIKITRNNRIYLIIHNLIGFCDIIKTFYFKDVNILYYQFFIFILIICSVFNIYMTFIFYCSYTINT